MKGLICVIAVALACCVTTCGALKCPKCTLVDTRAVCLQATQDTCTGSNTYCFTTQSKNSVIGEKWTSRCGTKAACDAGTTANKGACTPTKDTSTCIYCCNTDGCVGQPGAAVAMEISVVTMATAALVVIMKDALGF